MQSAITFLGTGGGRSVMADQSRATAGFIINVGSEQIHVDPGPGTVFRAAQHNISLRNTSMLLVSDEHLDNCNDLNLVIDVLTSGGIENRGTLITSANVVKNVLSDYHKDTLSKIEVLKAGEKTKHNKIIIKAIQTRNHDKAIGFKITTPKFVLGYTSDTSYHADLGKNLAKCDILIINNTFPFNKKSKHHLNSDDTVNLLKKTRPSLAILTHFGQDLIDKNPMYEAREIQKKTGIQVIAATDGLVIEPTSYSANAKQKNLMSYEQ